MIGRKPSLICIAGETRIDFLMAFADGRGQRLASLPLEAFVDAAEGGDRLPKTVRQSVNRLMVVPDYWIGNACHAFQARKRSIIAAFIERKLRLDQPALTEVGDFFSWSVGKDKDRRQLIHAAYLQEAVAYRLYRRLESLGISPQRIATPALIWQSRLGQRISGFGEQGVGFVHLTQGDCFLYFYFQGQFLFSRHIQTPASTDDDRDPYGQLNYEINQSFYLYSQKTKSAVDALYLLAPDRTAAPRLADLLGRPVHELPYPSTPADDDNAIDDPGSLRDFSLADIRRHADPSISYKPLRRELMWRPVQWAGMAVGLLLAALLSMESGYLHVRSKAVDREMVHLKASAVEPPEEVLGELSQSLDAISGALARPSGSATMMRTLLALPDHVTLRKVALDVSTARTLTIDAAIDADHPDRFRAILDQFLNRINDQFNLKERPLREKDVTIQLERREGYDRHPRYLIHLGVDLA